MTSSWSSNLKKYAKPPFFVANSRLRMSLSEFFGERLSFVAISFYGCRYLFGSCRLSEFTLARPLLYVERERMMINLTENNLCVLMVKTLIPYLFLFGVPPARICSWTFVIFVIQLFQLTLSGQSIKL